MSGNDKEVHALPSEEHLESSSSVEDQEIRLIEDDNLERSFSLQQHEISEDPVNSGDSVRAENILPPLRKYNGNEAM